MTTIGVCVPVGPNPANVRWLADCLRSVERQSRAADQVAIVVDGADIREVVAIADDILNKPTRVWEAPWQLGVAHAFNMGVALARTDLVFMLGSDDTIEADCLELCEKEFYRCAQNTYAYYYTGVRYMDTNELQTSPCNAAMVGRDLWNRTGGFPVQSASGAPDAAFISMMMYHGPAMGYLYPVADGKPVYNYRRHAETDTASKGPWQEVILATRHLVTLEWRPRLP